MGTILRVQRGGIQTIRFTAREVRDDSKDGRRIRINGATCSIMNPDATTQLAVTNLTYEKRGAYLLYWDTTNLALGDYEARVTFGNAFSTVSGGTEKRVPRRIILRLVETL